MDKIKKFFDDRAEDWDEYCPRNQEELALLLKDIDINKGDKVLDLACGTGVITNLLFEKCQADLYAIDLSSKMIDIAKSKYSNPKIHFLDKDFLFYDEKGFDAIVLFDAYPHFLNILDFKSQLIKSLKSGGKVYIIHDCSRGELNVHHMTFAKDVSRSLKPVEEEANYYSDYFDIIKAYEDDKTYQIYLRKQ